MEQLKAAEFRARQVAVSQLQTEQQQHLLKGQGQGAAGGPVEQQCAGAQNPPAASLVGQHESAASGGLKLLAIVRSKFMKLLSSPFGRPHPWFGI